jgi:hypothetical protein
MKVKKKFKYLLFFFGVATYLACTMYRNLAIFIRFWYSIMAIENLLKPTWFYEIRNLKIHFFGTLFGYLLACTMYRNLPIFIRFWSSITAIENPWTHLILWSKKFKNTCFFFFFFWLPTCMHHVQKSGN